MTFDWVAQINRSHRDDSRPEINHVQVVGGVAYASNGHVALVSPCDRPDGFYKTLDGSIIKSAFIALKPSIVPKISEYLNDATGLNVVDLSTVHEGLRTADDGRQISDFYHVGDCPINRIYWDLFSDDIIFAQSGWSTSKFCRAIGVTSQGTFIIAGMLI